MISMLFTLKSEDQKIAIMRADILLFALNLPTTIQCHRHQLHLSQNYGIQMWTTVSFYAFICVYSLKLIRLSVYILAHCLYFAIQSTDSGSVCLNSLNQNWQPTVNVRHILDTHILWLLKNGNPDDPLNTDAGQQMKAKDPKYPQIVRQWVKRHASQSQLASVGCVWYKDHAKKKKKKKKFCIAELSASKTPKQQSVETKMQQTPKKNECVTKRRRLSSKSVGHTEENIDFQDWWAQSKILPNTPTKGSKPQIRRSNSFCNRPDSSPWIGYVNAFLSVLCFYSLCVCGGLDLTSQ